MTNSPAHPSPPEAHLRELSRCVTYWKEKFYDSEMRHQVMLLRLHDIVDDGFHWDDGTTLYQRIEKLTVAGRNQENAKLRCRIRELESQLAAVTQERDDERGWNFQRKQNWEVIGNALAPHRKYRHTGEPLQGDAQEVVEVVRRMVAAEAQLAAANARIGALQEQLGKSPIRPGMILLPMSKIYGGYWLTDADKVHPSLSYRDNDACGYDETLCYGVGGAQLHSGIPVPLSCLAIGRMIDAAKAALAPTNAPTGGTSDEEKEIQQ